MLKWFWSVKFWLPENTTWADVTNEPGKRVLYAEVKDLWIQVPLTVVILVTRYIVERYCYSALGRWLNIKDKKKIAPPNAILEAAYMKSAHLNFKNSMSLSKQVDMTERQVERWWRLRRSQDKPSTLVKFCENMWKGTFYLCNFLVGLYVLWEKEWLWDLDTSFKGYPHQGITTDVKLYYFISTSFYWSIMITQFRDVRRKDIGQMFIHHIAAVAMLLLSWIGNGHRIGTLLLILHDSSDMLLELGKAAKYAGARESIVTTMFVVFAVVWIMTRMVWCPYILIKTFKIVFWSPLITTLYLLILCLLLPLHVIWTWIIVKIIYNIATSGEVPGDTRSSGSEES